MDRWAERRKSPEHYRTRAESRALSMQHAAPRWWLAWIAVPFIWPLHWARRARRFSDRPIRGETAPGAEISRSSASPERSRLIDGALRLILRCGRFLRKRYSRR